MSLENVRRVYYITSLVPLAGFIYLLWAVLT